jgi:5-methylcytosine-specific restriction enzyme subunit McrC
MKDKIIITIFQDYKTNIKEYKEYFEDIILIKDVIGRQNCILEVNGDISIKNYIGTFSTNRISLQVLPKIYGFKIIDNSNEIKESLDFVYRLLIWSNYFSFKTMKATRSIDSDNSLLDIIINIFINEFLSLHRKNVYREYIDIEKEELFLKGKVLFQKSIDYKPSKLFRKYLQ